MKKTLLAILTLISFQIYAQDCGGRYETEIYDTVNVATVDFGSAVNAAGDTQILKMDIYTAQGDTGTNRPVVIFCFGGSFVGGARTSSELVSFARSFAKRGYVCASIDYRVAASAFDLLQEEKMVKVVFGAVQDGKAAIRYFRKDARNGNALGIDSTQVFIGGTSAGGILAINLAYVDDVNKLTPTWQTWAAQIGGLEGNSGNPGYCSQPDGVFSFAGAVGDTSFIDANDVPFYSCHATGDQTVQYGYGKPINGLAPVYLYGSGDIETRMTNLGIYNSVDTYSGADHPPLNGTNLATTTTNLSTFLFNILDCNPNNLKHADQQSCKNSTIIPGDTVSGIARLNHDNDLTVYPNPANNYIVVKSIVSFEQIAVVDILGRVVFNENFSKTLSRTIYLESLTEGTYFVKVMANGVWQTERLSVK